MRTDGSHELAAARDSRQSALSRYPFIGGGRQTAFILFLSGKREVQCDSLQNVHGSVVVTADFAHPGIREPCFCTLIFVQSVSLSVFMCI